jgi:hypothetical protein
MQRVEPVWYYRISKEVVSVKEVSFFHPSLYYMIL